MEINQKEASSSMNEKAPDEALIFDRDAFFERTLHNKEIARKVIGIFLGEVPKYRTELEEYIKKGECSNISSCAHKIKGASSNIGGMALSNLAGKIERAANECENDIIITLMPEIEKQFDMLASHIKEV